VCGLISWQLYMRRLRKGDVPQSRLEVRETGNGPIENNEGSTGDIVAVDRANGICNSALEAETNEL